MARREGISITALSFVDASIPHMFLTGSEASTCLKLWDMRARFSRHKQSLPVSSTAEPPWHSKHRHFGVNSITVGCNGTRVYALSRDSTAYAYATSHLVLGHAPQLESYVDDSKFRHAGRGEDTQGVGPLYGLRHPKFHATSFFVKASIRPATRTAPELLAVGSSDGCAVLFPTDEATLRAVSAKSVGSTEQAGPLESAGRPSTPRRASLPMTSSLSSLSSSALSARLEDSTPIYEAGTPLMYGHRTEVSGVHWTNEGNLVTIGDDLTARCWRDDEREADKLRSRAAGRPLCGHGWAVPRSGPEDDLDDILA